MYMILNTIRLVPVAISLLLINLLVVDSLVYVCDVPLLLSHGIGNAASINFCVVAVFLIRIVNKLRMQK